MSKRSASARYAEQRDRYVERVLAFLADCHQADPAAMSVPLTDVRAFLHMSSATAFIRPVLAILRKRELVEVRVNEDGSKTIYFTGKFLSLVEEN